MICEIRIMLQEATPADLIDIQNIQGKAPRISEGKVLDVGASCANLHRGYVGALIGWAAINDVCYGQCGPG